jgi:hypothetical protein
MLFLQLHSRNSFNFDILRIASKGKGCFTNRDGPGPGTYDKKTLFARIRGAASFGRYKRIGTDKDDPLSKTAREIPGPGAYRSSLRVTTRNEPRPIFGSASRDQNTFYTT